MSAFLHLSSIFIAFLIISIEGLFPLKEVIDTTKSPFNSIGLIYFFRAKWIPDEQIKKGVKLWPKYTCTGTVISPIHILTAAHCVIDDIWLKPLKVSDDDWHVRFYPGLNEDIFTSGTNDISWLTNPDKQTPPWIDTKPYYKVTKMQKSAMYATWIYKEHFHDLDAGDAGNDYRAGPGVLFQYDYAILTLAKPLDDSLILQLKYDDGLKVDDTIYTAGYPGDKNPKWHMYSNGFKIKRFELPEPRAPGSHHEVKASDDIKKAPLIIDVSYEAKPGQSGSMLYRTIQGLKWKDKDQVKHGGDVHYEIIGIIVDEVIGHNIGVRLTPDIISELCNLMKKDDNIHWKKQIGCPSEVNLAHLSDINMLIEKYDQLLRDINIEKIEQQKTIKLLNKIKRRKKYGHHPYRSNHRGHAHKRTRS